MPESRRIKITVTLSIISVNFLYQKTEHGKGFRAWEGVEKQILKIVGHMKDIYIDKLGGDLSSSIIHSKYTTFYEKHFSAAVLNTYFK
jgi:hypothetical protein